MHPARRHHHACGGQSRSRYHGRGQKRVPWFFPFCVTPRFPSVIAPSRRNRNPFPLAPGRSINVRSKRRGEKPPFTFGQLLGDLQQLKLHSPLGNFAFAAKRPRRSDASSRSSSACEKRPAQAGFLFRTLNSGKSRGGFRGTWAPAARSGLNITWDNAYDGGKHRSQQQPAGRTA